MSELGTLWSEAPRTLRVYVVIADVGCILNAAVNRTAYSGIGAVLSLVVGYFLLKGVRSLWIFLVGITAIYFVAFLLLLGTNAIFYLIGLVLLLAPPTRRHFARDVTAVGP